MLLLWFSYGRSGAGNINEKTCEEILKDLYYGAQKIILEEAERWSD